MLLVLLLSDNQQKCEKRGIWQISHPTTPPPPPIHRVTAVPIIIAYQFSRYPWIEEWRSFTVIYNLSGQILSGDPHATPKSICVSFFEGFIYIYIIYIYISHIYIYIYIYISYIFIYIFFFIYLLFILEHYIRP